MVEHLPWRHLLLALLSKPSGLSADDAAIAFMRMLVACALCSGISTSLDRQSTALFQAWYPFECDATCGQFQWPTVHFVIRIFSEKLLQGYVIVTHDDIQTQNIVIPLGYSVVDPIGFLFWGAPFSLSFHECMWEESNRKFLAFMLLRQLCSTGIIWCICLEVPG